MGRNPSVVSVWLLQFGAASELKILVPHSTRSQSQALIQHETYVRNRLQWDGPKSCHTIPASNGQNSCASADRCELQRFWRNTQYSMIRRRNVDEQRCCQVYQRAVWRGVSAAKELLSRNSMWTLVAGCYCQFRVQYQDDDSPSIVSPTRGAIATSWLRQNSLSPCKCSVECVIPVRDPNQAILSLSDLRGEQQTTGRFTGQVQLSATCRAMYFSEEFMAPLQCRAGFHYID